MKKRFCLAVGRFMFAREHGSQHQAQRTMSFDEARSIGILYDSTEEKDFDLVRKYVKEIREKYHKEVLALGYFDQKELPPMRFSKLGLDFFTQSDLNWYYKPISAVVRNFAQKEFDILLDLHTGDSIPFRYIVAESRSRFKIGKYDVPNVKLYDFMLSTKEHLPFAQYIEQVKHYMNTIRHATGY